ncbi:MAG: plasmid mobilization relaxosome protein MobC [Christensenella sp.]
MLYRKIKVTFRLNEQEFFHLKKQIERSGYSQEAYIRSLIEGYVPRELPPADYHSMVKELRAIGNRMNRIAARANATGFFLAEEYAQNARRLFDEILEIRAAVVLPEKIR